MVAGRWSLSVLVNDSNWLMQDAVVVLASVGSFGLCRHFEESNREEAVWVMGGLCSSRSHLTRSIPKQEKIVTCFRKNESFLLFRFILLSTTTTTTTTTITMTTTTTTTTTKMMMTTMRVLVLALAALSSMTTVNVLAFAPVVPGVSQRAVVRAPVSRSFLSAKGGAATDDEESGFPVFNGGLLDKKEAEAAQLAAKIKTVKDLGWTQPPKRRGATRPRHRAYGGQDEEPIQFKANYDESNPRCVEKWLTQVSEWNMYIAL